MLSERFRLLEQARQNMGAARVSVKSENRRYREREHSAVSASTLALSRFGQAFEPAAMPVSRRVFPH